MLLLVCGVITTVFVLIFVETYLSAVGGTVVEMGEGDKMSVVKESSGFHVLQVDNTGSGDGQRWSWVEVICVIMAVKL